MGSPGSSILKELDDLKKLLQTPNQPSPPPGPDTTSTSLVTPPPGGQHLDIFSTYDTALNSAEKTATRLNKAMELAEEEMEAALKRTGDVHRDQASKYEIEAQELRRVIAAKERSIDHLREQLSTAKRLADDRIYQAEGALADRDVQLRELKQELQTVRAERDRYHSQIQEDLLMSSRQEQQAKAREQELAVALKRAQDDYHFAVSDLRKEQKEREHLQLQADKLVPESRMLKEQLKIADAARRKAESVLQESSKELDDRFRELLRKYKAERHVRKASERWLQAELQAREEMETLFLAMRDLAFSKGTDRSLEERLQQLRAEVHSSSAAYRHSAGRLGSQSRAPTSVGDDLAAWEGAADHTRRLQKEVAYTKQKLKERLKRRGAA